MKIDLFALQYCQLNLCTTHTLRSRVVAPLRLSPAVDCFMKACSLIVRVIISEKKVCQWVNISIRLKRHFEVFNILYNILIDILYW